MTRHNYFGSVEHANDMAVIASTPGAQLGSKILGYEASADEVMDWYGSDDPCNEDLNWRLVRSLASGGYSAVEAREMRFDFVTESTALNEAAGLTLLLSTAGISRGGSPGNPWTKAGHPIVDRALASAEKSDGLASQLIRRSLVRPTSEDFDKLYVVADCLQMASLGLHNFAVEGKEDRLDVPDFMDYFRRSRQYRKDVRNLTAVMFDRLQKQGKEERLESRPMLHRLGALLTGLSIEDDYSFVGDKDRPQLTETMKHNFEFLVELIDKSYLKWHQDKVVKGGEKGDLHELLFLLDTNYLFTTGDGRMGEWFTVATTDRHDAPKIGYPSKKRGTDFLISNLTRSRLVQLKSSTNDDSEYHPWILKLEEENFQEVDKRRLAAKLAAYRQWFESGFDPALQAKVDKYVLPSAREAYDTMQKEAAMPESERIIQIFGGDLTRAERRRIMRNCGDFKQRRQTGRK